MTDGTPVSPRPEHVLLLSLPFGALERPSLALGLLQAHCARNGTACETVYLTFPFAETVGLEDYRWVCSELPYTAFAGEWLFAQALHGPNPEADERYVEDVLHGVWQLSDSDVSRLLRIREQVETFLQHSLSHVRDEHTFVGFTSVFHQNVASLALAGRVKKARPDATIAFGGANWEEPMGSALLEQFPFVDLAFSGEADRSFPAVLAARRAGTDIDGVFGVTRRQHRLPPVPAARPAPSVVIRLDDVPTPDFDAYFARLATNPALSPVTPTLPVETSRGCWWGERSHCTFCGLNGSTMSFRSKTPQRVLDELAALRARYGARLFGVVDNILDPRYFGTVLPLLACSGLDIELFWEVKANLSRRQVRSLRDAGVMYVQPGIESFSNHVLTLMRKGTTGLRNLELLKWCREYGVTPLWNLLYGFPGEGREDYAETDALIRAAWHLDPPFGYGPVRLDRFSPYHDQPATFGMTNVRPMAAFRSLYPVDDQALDRIAYYFDFDYAAGHRADTYAHDVMALVAAWQQDDERGSLTISRAAAGDLHVVDTRYGAASPAWTVLSGWHQAVYWSCDRSQLLGTLVALPEVRAAGADEHAVRDFLDRCVRDRLMVHQDGRWLALAVHTPAREDDDGSPSPLPVARRAT